MSLNPANIIKLIKTSTRINSDFPLKCLLKENNKLNVFISRYLTETLTKEDCGLIRKKFTNSKMLLLYLSQTLHLQINNEMVKVFNHKSKFTLNEFQFKIVIISCDLIHVNSGENLYAIITKNNDLNKKQFEWKIDYLWTKTEIFYYYKVDEQDLPSSFREISFIQSHPSIQSQLTNKNRNIAKQNIIGNIDNININNMNSKSIKICMKMEMNSKLLQKCIKKSISNNNNQQFIPILIQKNNKRWIEWVIICDRMDNNFGISFKKYQNKTQVTNIYINKKDIEIKNNLTGDQLKHPSLINFCFCDEHKPCNK